MATTLSIGNPNTLALTDDEVQSIADSLTRPAELGDALRRIKAEHGLPAHAPVGLESLGRWALHTLILTTDARRIKREGLALIKTFAGRQRVNVYAVRHLVIG